MASLWSRGSPWRLSILPLLAMLLAVACPASFTNLLTNGSFEVPVATGSFDTVTTNTIANWTVVNTVDLIGTYWQPAEGAQSLDLAGNSAGQIYQDVATVSGREYYLSFQYAGNPDGPPDPKDMGIYWGDSKVGLADRTDLNGLTPTPLPISITGTSKTAMGWKTATYAFTPTWTTKTRIGFGSLDGSSPWGPALDDVKLVTPEPSSWALLGLAVGVPLWFRRRKRS